MRWVEKPSWFRAKLDRFGFTLTFAVRKYPIVYDVLGPDKQHRLAIAVMRDGRIRGGVSQEEWDSDAYGLRTAILKGLRMRGMPWLALPENLARSVPEYDSKVDAHFASHIPTWAVCRQCGGQSRPDSKACGYCGYVFQPSDIELVPAENYRRTD